VHQQRPLQQEEQEVAVAVVVAELVGPVLVAVVAELVGPEALPIQIQSPRFADRQLNRGCRFSLGLRRSTITTRPMQ
jgi:hypothetical protein